ncbi:MAG: heavy metal translocating P-type ATPase [Planctomycetaceae bacterium]|nr:heavy metal translocating P-type ATPase [Planctomycetaceae bacterium]
MHLHAHGVSHDLDPGEPGGASPSPRTHGPYAELVWPAIAGVALAAGYFLARGAGEGAGSESNASDPLRYASYACYAVAYVVGGWEATRDGLKQLAKGRLDIDFLMVVAAIGAALVAEFFEGALLLFLFSLGHGLEHLALSRARSAVTALARLAPKTARVRAGDGTEREVPVESVSPGDLVVVRPGERIAADGRVEEGRSGVDQSPLTGESMPVEKEPGSEVFAGSLNGDGALVVKVSRRAGETLVARMVKLVAEAQASKSTAERAAERFTRVYVPCVLVATALAIVAPPLFGWLTWNEAFLRAMSMLIGASPCALAISTPAAVLAGLARAARGGVLVKGGAHLESLGLVRAIAVDKTGTITRGRPEVAEIACMPGVDERELLRVAASVESVSSHPIAHAVVVAAAARGIEVPAPQDAAAVKGKGVEATVDGVRAGVGRAKLFEGHAQLKANGEVEALARAIESRAMTAMSVVHGARALGAIGVRDTPRPEAKTVVAALTAQGCTVTMLTGDNAATAKAVAAEVGIASVEAGLMPEDKIARIKALVTEHGAVAMVGDGVNDAPALAAATVGVAMGHGGTDVALEAADVALMQDDLTRLPFAIDLGRATRTMIRQNVIFSMGVVIALIPLTLFGIVPLPIAVVCHEGSTVLVALHGLRLLSKRDRFAGGVAG